MPNISKLFAPVIGWDLESLPASFSALAPRYKDADGIYGINTKGYSTLHADITKAVLMYTGLVGTHNNTLYGEYAVVKVSDTIYASERKLDNGAHEIATYNTLNGNIEAAVINTTGRYSVFGELSRNAKTDCTTVFLAMLPHIAGIDPKSNDILSKKYCDIESSELYYISDVIYQEVNYGSNVPVIISSDGNLDLISKKSVENGVYNGYELKGTTTILNGSSSGVLKPKSNKVMMKEAKALFIEYADSKHWTEEEKLFIPQFPDDFEVPPEALKIAQKFVQTSGDINPMRNFMWRGVTSYGKSTGIAAMACMLNMPLLKITCNTNMETQSFLADYVPDTSAPVTSNLPDFETIKYDPEGAYLMLTGINDENATEDMCLKAYGEAFAKLNASTPKYKFVESNYVKALTRGYIIEIQECSRIKDPGVLVGLNEFDRPGAVIPLIDGSYKRRDKDAIVIYTDNIGYVSCRPIDPSVIRRNALVINSYDLPKEMIISRVKYNTKADDHIVESCYNVWSDIKSYCADHDITEGDISATELEMCILSIKYDRCSVRDSIIECIISKLTTDKEDYDELVSMIDTNLGKYNL